MGLWSVEDQQRFLAELIAMDAEGKDAPLRRDVRNLGKLLGDVIREQAGEKVFAAVERLRTEFIDRRESREVAESRNRGVANDMRREVDGQGIRAMSVEMAWQVARAFSIYFELANLAETNHRKRRRRAAEVNHASPQPGTMAGTLRRMKAAGITAEQALEWLGKVEAVPVFTAHPTEVARRTTLMKRSRLSAELERLGVAPLTDEAARRSEERIEAEIASLWQSDEVRQRKPTVRDEIRMGLDYYRSALLETLPQVYEIIRDGLREAYGVEVRAEQLPITVRFGSWIGGDRDGNPFVTAEETRRALEMAREIVFDHYGRAVRQLLILVSSSTSVAEISEEMDGRIEEYRRLLPQIYERWQTYSATESYREMLLYVQERLRLAAKAVGGGAYESAEVLGEDRRSISSSQRARGTQDIEG